MALIAGWGRGTWSEGAWSSPLPVTVTGVAATGQIGSVTVSGASDVPVTGLEATGSVGSVTVVAEANVSPSGLSATGQVGSVEALASAVVSVTGISSTGSVGSVAVVAESNTSVTGVSSVGSVGSLTVAANADVSPTGIGASGNVGSVTTIAEANVSPTGVSATGEVGEAGVQQSAAASVSGVSATAAVGSVTVSANADVSPTGIEATGIVGSVTATGIANITVTGLEGISESGTATVNAGANVPTTGLQAIGSVGSVTVVANADVSPTGVEATGAVGSVDVEFGITVPVTGVEGTGLVGSVTLSLGITFPVTGVEAAGSVGSVTTTADSNVSVTGVSGTGQVGSVVASIPKDVSVTGVSATGQVGSVTVTAASNVFPDGVSGTGKTSQVLVWGPIVPNQNPSYTPITPSSTPSWSDESPSQTPGWEDIAAQGKTMPSTYTTNNGIEKIATGEQSGTWGDTTNVNFDLLDEALDGQVSVALAGTGTSGSPNDLAITDGTSSNGRNRFVEFTGTPGGDTYVRLTPNDAEKVLFIQNSTNQTLLLFQGTYDAARDYSLAAGLSAVIRFTGGGTTSYAYNVFTGLGVAGNVDITGGFTATSGSTITTADNTTQLTLLSTDEDASEGPRLDLRRDSASPAAGDLIGTIRYLSDDDAGTTTVYGEIQLEADTVTAGATDGQMRLMIRNNGNLRNALTLDKTQNIFNDSGDDVDFRIESTGNTHAFFFEGSSGNVGIGTSSPGFPLDVKKDGGAATLTARIYNEGTNAADDASLRIGIAGTTGQTNIFFGDGDSSTSGRLIYDHNNDAMVTYVNGSEAMRIDSSGNLGIGTSSPGHDLDVQRTAADAIIRAKTTNTGDADALFIADANDTGEAEYRMYSGGVQKATVQWNNNDELNITTTTAPIDLQPSGNNVMRVQDTGGDGRVGIENTSPSYTFEVHSVAIGGSGGEEGFAITSTGSVYSSTNNTSQVYLNDSSGSAGTHNYILFRYQGSTIGDIDTTDNTTIRYNTFVGAHWSQTAAINVLKGTIMSTIDEMMEWTDFEHTDAEGNLEKLAMAGHADYVIGQEYTIPCDEDGNTVTATAVGQTTDKRLAKVKVSDVASDRSVYGVFGGQYADGDVSVESLGASFIRIGSGVTVQNGDLIESAGDGTGRVQADDIMRSCTVAKITSTIAKETFDDGSKLYPCTLHCG